MLRSELEHDKAQNALLRESNARYEARVAQLEAAVRARRRSRRENFAMRSRRRGRMSRGVTAWSSLKDDDPGPRSSWRSISSGGAWTNARRSNRGMWRGWGSNARPSRRWSGARERGRWGRWGWYAGRGDDGGSGTRGERGESERERGRGGRLGGARGRRRGCPGWAQAPRGDREGRDGAPRVSPTGWGTGKPRRRFFAAARRVEPELAGPRPGRTIERRACSLSRRAPLRTRGEALCLSPS